MGQVRTLKAQLETNYDISITSQHPIIPWLVRHTVYLLNRYATHADGNTVFYRRWNKEHRTPLCEFGETPLSTTTCEGPTKTRKQISPSNLAWQRHSNRRNTPWHSNNGCTFQNNQEATNAREVQQTVDGHHPQQRTERVPNGHCSVLWLGASALGERTWCHCWAPLQGAIVGGGRGAIAGCPCHSTQQWHPEKASRKTALSFLQTSHCSLH